jgi:hypothetical protein
MAWRILAREHLVVQGACKALVFGHGWFNPILAHLDDVAEWLGSGLQPRSPRFEPGRRLQRRLRRD